MPRNDLVGKRFGKLVALRPTEKRSRQGAVYWHCKCDCGNEIDVTRPNLMQGHYVSCGCVNAENNKKFREIAKEFRERNYVDGSNLLTHNQKISKNNSTGVKGVSPFYSKGVFQGYRAYITYQRKHYSGGVYPTIKEAARARKKLEEKFFKKNKVKVGKKKLEYSKESLIKAVQLEFKNTGSVPAQAKFRYGQEAARLFGTWNAFLSAANLPTRAAKYSEEFLIAEYKKLKEALCRRPVVKEYRYYAAVKYRWGSWSAFLSEIEEDFAINKKKKFQGKAKISEQILISEFRELAKKEGDTPRSDQFKRSRTAQKRFGSWNEFVSACGLPPRERTDRKKVKYSDEFLVKEFIATKEKLKHVPIMHEFQYAYVAQRRFGKWSKFVEFAENYKKGAEDG
ncbi:hypothetical protein GIX45_28240 [Erwinia sp. CPCC 100877]|nr:hypothetical protein [Erwinia sp. CPCC 100877]